MSNSILVVAAVAALVLRPGTEAVRAQAEQHLFVTTTEGQVYGLVQAGIAAFKGMPYAAPPIGDLRWRPPQPAAPRSDILQALNDGPPCLQPPMRDGSKLETTSEDCLTINVFRPFEVEGALPVMVWLHGGSFTDGAGGDPLSDGSRLAREGLIVVTFNYRLGALGWLADQATGVDANLGMMDQIAALRWVAGNIAAFGGDAGNVTLFGDTAGANSVALLMVSEVAAGLFQKAIIQSGKLRAAPRPLVETQADARAFFKILGAEASRWREVGSEQLLDAQTTLLGDPRTSFAPTLDGKLVTENIIAAFKAGHERSLPLIIGSNADETRGAAEAGRSANLGFELNLELALSGDNIDVLKRLYPDAGADPRQLAAELFSDRHFVEPARFAARAHAARNAPTYRYHFSYRRGSPRGSAASGPEVEFVFGTLGTQTAGPFTFKDRETSNVMRAYWANFARTGDPNGAGLPAWPRYTADEPMLMIANDGISATRDPWTARLDRLQQQSEYR